MHEPSAIYRYTSLARPVDTHFPTNRWLLILLLLTAIASAALAFVWDLPRGPMASAINTTLAAFVAWALTREFAPDDEAAAFIALAMALPAALMVKSSSVLLAFVALLLVRIVNRSTGLAARITDTVVVLGVTIWATIRLEQEFLLLVAAVLLLVDATASRPLRWQYAGAAIFAVAFIVLASDGVELSIEELMPGDWILMVVLLIAVACIAWWRIPPAAVGDTTGERLNAYRVNAGLLGGLFLGIQALLGDGPSAWLGTPLWACIVAVVISWIASRAVRLGLDGM